LDLEGRLAVVTGGASGLGFAAAERLASSGAEVLLVGRSATRLEAAAERIGGKADVRVADVSDPDQLRDLFEDLVEVNVLITCAGWSVSGLVTEVSMAKVRDLFDTRLLGQLAAVAHGVPKMPVGSAIVLCSGVADRLGRRGYSAGTAVDGAINALTRQLAVELGPLGIRVNAVSPGMISDTDHETGLPRHVVDRLFAASVSRVPQGRLGLAADVADVIHFLVSTTYVSGHVIEVDGGWSVT